jgi:predicted nucleic acid-binding protein
MKYAIDTNIISYYLKGNIRIVEKLDSEVEKDNIIIPTFVYYEIKKWLLGLNSTIKLFAFDRMFQKFGVNVIEKETLDMALSIYINLRKKGIIVDDGDLLIAAYCVKNNYTLVTNNEKHFEKIKNLQVVNWAI